TGSVSVCGIRSNWLETCARFNRMCVDAVCFFFSSRRRHTRSKRDWSSDVCSSDLKPPSGVYRLTISVFLVNPSVPDLMIEVNGHKGRFYFDRKISYYPGDDRIDSPIYGGDTLAIDLPAKFFKAKENKLVLTAVEDADNPDTRASLIYDALKLTQCPSRRVQPSAAVKPSVFFRQKENQTYEVTRVTVTVADKLRPGSVDLSMGGKHFRAALAGANDFGQERIDFDVPEFSGQVMAN